MARANFRPPELVAGRARRLQVAVVVAVAVIVARVIVIVERMCIRRMVCFDNNKVTR